MQANEWKAASEQLLAHWRRSGITQIPVVNETALSDANAWLKQNADAIYTHSTSADAAPDSGGLRPENPANHVQTAPSVNSKVVPGASPSLGARAAPTLDATKNEIEVVASPAVGSWTTPAQDFVSRQSSLEVLNEQVIACRKCEEIVCRRQRTVFGVGSLQARVVMFGEAPGADEDRVGEPFVGAAGQLLDKILAASSFKREEVYIMNSLKCRPPNNRTPAEIEIENCRPFFESQLETIQPEYIVCWGAVAVRAVLKSTESVGRLRGRFHNFRGAKVVVTYHPAYLLRNPDAKRLTWEDMKMLMRDMGIPIPGKG